MKSFQYIITDEIGLHARPAGLLAQVSKPFASNITLETKDKHADAKKLMAIMAMGVKKDVKVVVRAEGVDENLAIAKLETFFKETL